MKRRLRAPSPALVISLIALFVALGGAAAAASGLISGNQIVNHSIAAKKLTAAAVKTLHGHRGPAGPQGVQGATGLQGPGAISFAKYQVAATNGFEAVGDLVGGITVFYDCEPAIPTIEFRVHAADTTGLTNLVFSGESAADGALKSVQQSGESGFTTFTATSTLNLDGIVWTGTDSQSGGTVTRIDVGGRVNGTTSCDVWGQLTSSS
jgi:hypothetical protein